MKNNHIFLIIFLLVSLFFLQRLPAQEILLTTPQPSSQFTLPATIPFEATLAGVAYPEPIFLRVQNTLSGYRKLKLGYSATSLYTPLQNVVAGGNTRIEITMKVIGGTPDWTKIMIKPMGLGSLALHPYIVAAGGIGSNWASITIPLADFASTINFSQIANIEFPYSASSAPFEIGISLIKFTGGTTPFTWFGEGKTNNKHNGNGGSGELIAFLNSGTSPIVYPQKVEFYAGDSFLGEDLNSPYQFNWINPGVGTYMVSARLIMSDNQVFISQLSSIDILPPVVPDISVALTQPLDGDTIMFPASLQMEAQVTGLPSPESDHLRVSNPFTGYRKLKLGYSPTSLYSPLINVIAGGNSAIEITLRDVSGGTNWSRIQIRPAGIGTLNLLPYVQAAGGVGANWTTITIPLSHFSSTINFSAITNLEFPYSASANNFTMEISSIRFIGGTDPFVWFGYGKTNNMHNGNGGTAELIASLILGNTSGNHIEKVEFYSEESKLGEDVTVPYQLTVNDLAAGSHSLTARMISHEGNPFNSPAVNLMVYQPAFIQSPMSVKILSPKTSSSWLAPLNMPVDLEFAGAIPPGIDYMKVKNTMTGYVKMKFGYSATSLYTPKQNVIHGGNDTLELVIRNIGGPVDWSKIRVRPSAIGFVNLGPYATAAGGIGSEWVTIKIPLSAFDTAIDFSAISYFEFPYSAGANSFEIGIQRMRFTGGTSPFTWFGNGKTNNFHDGDGTTGHMAATIVSPVVSAIDVAGVQLFDNEIMVSEDFQAPFTLTLSDPQPGQHNIYAKMVDTQNALSFSDTIAVNILSEVPDGYLVVTVNFDAPPTSIAVNKAALRYDKDFAYSVSFDDGLVDAYTCAFKLLNGGYSPATFSTYPGLFYSDGCGNDIPFRASLMWNSVSSGYNEIHVNTPGYVNWSDLNLMLNAGWAVVNHGYSHANGAGTNYAYEITANDSAIFSHTGIHPNHMALPSGDAGFYPAAWQLGMKCVYSRNTANGSPYGLNITSPLNYNQFTVYRDFKSDDMVSFETISDDLDNCATLSQNGNHYWYNDFTHHVSPATYGGSLVFPLFQNYMEHAEKQYGKSGSDRMWMASGVEVFDYLRVRDAAPMTWSSFGNQLRILIDRDSLPSDLQKYALSLVIDADAVITSVELNDVADFTYRATTPRKLINLEWSAPAIYSMTQGSDDQILPDNNPVAKDHIDIEQVAGSDDVLISLSDKSSVHGQLSVYDMKGRAILVCDLHEDGITGKIRLELPPRKAGIYLFRFVGDDGRILSGKCY